MAFNFTPDSVVAPCEQKPNCHSPELTEETLTLIFDTESFRRVDKG